MLKLDLKKILKPYYNARAAPAFIDIPPMNFLMVDGAGNPNTSQTYAEAVQGLYSLAYTLKFKIKKEFQVDYPVMALEGLWWSPDMQAFTEGNKDEWLWTMMVSIPDLITSLMFVEVKKDLEQKKDLPALSKIRLEPFTEGLSAQIMHIGPYAAEAENIRKLHEFIHSQGYTFNGLQLKHHEIYLSDPRRTAPEKLRTIIRQAVNS